MSEVDGPAARIVAVFAQVARSRMAGLPLCNPALQVSAPGFRRWQGHWLGALVTPWCLNLLLLPEPATDCERRPGALQWWRFPSGDYPFVAHRDPCLGDYQSCSLFSPVFEFAEQAAAEAVALEALAALLREAHAPQRAPSDEAPLSRRGFLIGDWRARPA